MKSPKENIYLIPGQGADYRLFNRLSFDTAYTIHKLNYITPEKGMSMHKFAKKLSEQIDKNKPFILIGTSLGGMLAVEMNAFLNPVHTIIISSAKSKHELPWSYRFQRYFPIYRIIPAGIIKLGAHFLQPIVEPDRKKEKDTFKAMLKDKDPLFLSRTIHMIINWKRTEYPIKVTHIHGNKDRTIPIKRVAFDYLVEDGSHMMTLTRGEEIKTLIHSILEKRKTYDDKHL